MKKPTISNNYSLIVGVIIISIVGLLVVTTYKPSSSPIDSTTLTATKPQATTLLSFSSDLSMPVLGQETNLPILIDSQGASLTGAEIELSYDPSMIKVISVKSGDFFTQVLSSPSIKNGVIKFTYASSLDQASQNGQGKLATIQFKPLKAGTTKITFSPSTYISSIADLTNNALLTAKPITLTIGN